MKLSFIKEHLFYIGCSFVILALNIFPYIFAFLFAPEGRIFSGQLFIYYDVPTYYEKMRAGFEGLFTYHNFFTTETPNPDIPVYLFYNLLGHATRIFQSDIPTIFFTARIIFGALLLASIVWFLKTFVHIISLRIVSFSIILFASGFGWIFFLIYLIFPFSFHREMHILPDLLLPEFIPMARFAFHPHYLFAQSLFLIALISTYRILVSHQRRFGWALGLAGSLSLLALVLPFHLPVVYGIIFVMIAYVFFKEKSFLKILPAAIGLAVSLLPLAWMHSLLSRAPLWNIIEQQNVIPPLPIFTLIIGWGFFGIGAGVYTGRRIRQKKYDLLFITLVAWISIAIMLMYFTSFPMRRRFIETGVYIPLAILSGTLFLGYIKNAINTYSLKKWIVISSIIVSSCASSVAAYAIVFSELTESPAYIKVFYSQKTLDALYWISNHTKPESIILGSLQTGNIIPYYANRTTYFGHIPETIDGTKKNSIIEKFYGGNMTKGEAVDFLKKNSIHYVVESEHEKEKIRGNVFPYPFLRVVYSNTDTTVYTTDQYTY